MIKYIGKYMIMAVALFTMAACSQDEMFEPIQHGSTLSFVVGDFPAYDAATRTIGTPDPGKTAWTAGDEITITAVSPKSGTQTATLTYNGSTWTLPSDNKLAFIESEEVTITAVYGNAGGTSEYLTGTGTLSDDRKTIEIHFNARTYSRLRIAGLKTTAYTVTTTGFTPAGATAVATEGYTLTTDEKGNAYLYGMWESGSVTVVNTDLVVNETKTIGTTTAGMSYALAARAAYTYDEATNTYYVYKAEGLTTWAATTGTTAKLMNDISLETPISIEGTNTLDLNGYTLKNAEVFTSKEIDGRDRTCLIYIDYGCALTINDSSTDKTGIVSHNQGAYTILLAAGSLTVSGGTISNTATDASYQLAISGSGYTTIESVRYYSTVTIADGTFVGEVAVNHNNMSISGGTFEILYVCSTSSGTSDNLTGGTFEKIVDYDENLGLSNALCEGYSYYDNTTDTVVTPEDGATTIENVTVKASPAN